MTCLATSSFDVSYVHKLNTLALLLHIQKAVKLIRALQSHVQLHCIHTFDLQHLALKAF